jgi:hypothetical protein
VPDGAAEPGARRSPALGVAQFKEGSMVKALQAERVETPGVMEAFETCFANGWTDGLPVIPATETRVIEFLEYAGLEGDEGT